MRYSLNHWVRAAIFLVLTVTTAVTGSTQNPPPGAMMQGAQPAGQPGLVGAISAINGNTIFLLSGNNQVKTILIKSDTAIVGRKLATLASIQPGEALGVAATKEADGSLTATSINVFPPETWQRARKGQFPMAGGQVMTNAQVERLGSGVKGRVLYLKYDMLTAAITVPDTAEIRRTLPLKLADLKIGQKLTVRGTSNADGSLAASAISLELSN